MSEDSLITDDLRNLLNVEFGPKVYEIERGMVRKFVEAIDDPNPAWEEVAPPTFPTVLRLDEFFNKLWTVKCPCSHRLNGGSELEYYQKIKVGDVISVIGKLIDIQERTGKIGKMLFMILEITYINQEREMVARGRNTFIRY